MTRRLGLGVVAVAATVAGAGCAGQSSDGHAATTSPSAPARSADDASWVGAQVSPGLNASWVGPQRNPGLNSSWVGMQIDPGLDSSWAGPQYTAVPQAAAPSTLPPTTAAAAPDSMSPPTTTSVPPGGDVGFVPASEQVTAAVTAAVGRTEAAYDAAVRDLSNPALRDALAATTVDGSGAEELFLGWYDLVIAEGYTYVPPADGDNATTLMPGSVINVDRSGHLAFAQVCSASGDTIVDHDGAGTEVVVNSGWTAYEVAQIFQLTAAGTQWLLSDQIDLTSHPGERACAEVPPSSVPSASPPES